MFRLTTDPIDARALGNAMEDPACGAFVAFEGRVRDHHEGRPVLRLEYEAYPNLARTEGEAILQELKSRFGLARIECVHRTGSLEVGETAVWVGAIAAHRGECFQAVAQAMDRIKHRVPIWKHEFYRDGSEAWVHCSHGHDGHGREAA